jgi:CheY-like chemotaxis protein
MAADYLLAGKRWCGSRAGINWAGYIAWASASCVVADIRMPGMTGLELYQTLVASGDGIPTVIITAHPEDVTRSRAREAGITCYLSKPFAPDELVECVREALAKPRGPIPKS